MGARGEGRPVAELVQIARRLRVEIIEMLAASGSGHPGGSLSAVEILTALYFHEMRHRPAEPRWTGRDRFVLSKGHGCPALYAVLAEAGYLPRESLRTLRRLGSPLQGHPDRRFLPVIETNTGSLGQGLSFGVGAALGLRMDGSDARVYVLLGDGETNEGQVWEAALWAGTHGVDNLCAVTDINGIQNDTFCNDLIPLEPLGDKWRAMGWNVLDVDGHDVAAVASALEAARACAGRPTMVLARTVKGKGVSFMENQPRYHGVAPSADERTRALAELAASAAGGG